jgi:hypothetical protein
MTETINHPEYYGGDDTYEVIKVLEAWDLELAKGFCWGNMIKYSARAGKKTANEVQDRLKAEWYANRLATITATLEGRKATDAHHAKMRPALPKVNSHWIWKEADKDGPRCRLIVKSLRSDCVHTTTIAIEGQPLPVYGLIKSSMDLDHFFRECTPWDEKAINPWDAEVKVWPQLGTESIWEKDNPHARCRVKVTKINKMLGNESVTCKVITRDATGTCVIGSEVVNDLKRWHEATTPIPNWPYSWESAVMK